MHKHQVKEKESLAMDEVMEMSTKLWEANKDSWSPMTPEHAKNFILYMVEEIGEVISIVKKKGEDEIMNNPQVRDRFIEEMCDIMMYHSDVLNRFGVTPEAYSEKYRDKYNKNMNRNYKRDHAES